MKSEGGLNEVLGPERDEIDKGLIFGNKRSEISSLCAAFASDGQRANADSSLFKYDHASLLQSSLDSRQIR